MNGDRVLTVKQPHASLEVMDDGTGRPVKGVENRSWPVPSTLPKRWRCICGALRQRDKPVTAPWCGCAGWDIDGPFPARLWIHAGLRVDKAGGFDACRRYADLARPRGVLVSPVKLWMDCTAVLGALLGYVYVTGCHHAEDCWELRGSEHGDLVGPAPDGWYCSPWAQPGDVWHWTLDRPHRLARPIPMKGRQGLWRLPADALAALDDGRESVAESEAT